MPAASPNRSSRTVLSPGSMREYARAPNLWGRSTLVGNSGSAKGIGRRPVCLKWKCTVLSAERDWVERSGKRPESERESQIERRRQTASCPDRSIVRAIGETRCCIAAPHSREGLKTNTAPENPCSLLFPTTDEIRAQPPSAPAPAGKTHGGTTDKARRVPLFAGNGDSLRRWNRPSRGAELRAVPSSARPGTRGKVLQ